MSKHRKPYYLLILCAMISMVTTACFRDSAENIGTVPVAQSLSATTVLEETQTEATQVEQTGIPTLAATSAGQLATEAPPDTYALTATVLIQRLTQDAVPVTEQASGNTATAASPATAVPAVAATAVPIIRNTLIPGADCTHEIRAGDTLFTLSQAYGVSVEALTNYNSISDPNRILIGQRLAIPRCGTTGFLPPATTTSTPTDAPPILVPTEQAAADATAASGEVSDPLVEEAQQRILTNAQINTNTDGTVQGAEAVSTASRTYVVRQYDTLYDIAQLFDTTMETIAQLNGIDNFDDIRMGDVLQIP